MDCPCRWAVLLFMVFLKANEICVSSQTLVPETKREINQNPVCNNNHLNTLYSFGCSNGGQQDLVPSFQFTYPQEQPCQTVYQDVGKPINVIPLATQLSSYYHQEPIIVNSQPTLTTTSFSNVSPTTTPNLYHPSVPPSMQSTCRSEQPEQTNYGNYIQQSTNWPVLTPPNEIHNCNPVQSTLQESSKPPVESETLPSTPEFHTKIDSKGCEYLSLSCKPAEQSEGTCDYKQGLPVNLQINIPSPNTPAPTITVVSASPPSKSLNTEPLPCSVVGYPPPPPIIITKSQSSWKKLLPFILIALLCDQDNCGGCCSNCCNSDNPIPIPYPIPVAVNCPMMDSGDSSSCKGKKKSKCGDSKKM